MKGLGLALVAVLGLAAALWRLSDDDEAATSPAPDRGRPARVVSTHHNSPSLPSREGTVTVPEIQERPHAKPTMDQEASIAEQSLRLDARFTAEAADVRWASDTSRTITDDIQKASSRDVRIDRVECRASLCRAELAMTSLEAGNAFLETWVRQTTWQGSALFAPDPEAKRMVIYLGKVGTTLAQLD
jgi:hypothetical protein